MAHPETALWNGLGPRTPSESRPLGILGLPRSREEVAW